MSDEEEDPIEELARELRQGPGAELRAEAEITELETHLGRLRRRSLADVAREAMHRGDRVTVVSHGRAITGDPVFVGTDYLVVATDHQYVDVRLDRVVLTVTRSPAGGHHASGGSRTIKARLAEYEQSGEPVTLVCADIPHEVSGRIVVAASDHLVVATADGEEVVPTAAVSLVLRPRPRPR